MINNTNTVNSNTENDFKNIMKQFTEPEFFDDIMKKFNIILNDINAIDRFLFSEYHNFIVDVQTFKTSLLKFVFDAQTYFFALNKNMKSNGFKQLSEDKQLKFIEARLNRMDINLLLQYVESCKRFIVTAIKLYDEYDTTVFKVKFMVLNVVGFSAIGLVAGLAIGLVLPFMAIIESGTGMMIGTLGGLVFGIYQLAFKWNGRMQKVEKIRENLKQIHNSLIMLELQLHGTHNAVNQSQLELNHQLNQQSFLGVENLQAYVISTYDQFKKLENTLLHEKLN